MAAQFWLRLLRAELLVAEKEEEEEEEEERKRRHGCCLEALSNESRLDRNDVVAIERLIVLCVSWDWFLLGQVAGLLAGRPVRCSNSFRLSLRWLCGNGFGLQTEEK
jgi:hypothetical protein